MSQHQGQGRPYKVRFHYEGTKRFDGGVMWIDHNAPIDGQGAYAEEAAAVAAAQNVSRLGGRAEVVHRDRATGVETAVCTYEPYEVVLEEMRGESEREG